MSVIRKQPYVEKVLSKCTDSQITQIGTILNSYTDNLDRSLYTSGKFITSADKGKAQAVNLELELGLIRSGILIYNDYTENEETKTQCVLFTYNRFQEMQIYEIESDLRHYTRINEELTLEEFRRVYGMNGGDSEDKWVKVMKNYIAYDEDEEEVEIGTDLFVDGEVVINDIDDFVDTDGNAWFVQLTESEYEALTTKNATTLYIVVPDED